MTAVDALRLYKQGFIVLIDIRPHYDYLKGHLVGAVNVAFNLQTMTERIHKVTPKSHAVILISDGAAQIQATLHQMSGDASVVVMATCVSNPEEWRKAGLNMQALQVI